jgi:dihydroorotase
MKIWIKNGRVIDPANDTDDIRDLVIQNGIIAESGENLSVGDADKIIDADGKWVIPGLIDLHVHLREPGFEQKETIATGTRSGALGGFTTICCMPNTSPVIDNEILVEYVKLKAEREGVINVLPIGAITKGQEGLELADIGSMAKVGICAISEDGKTVDNAGLMKTAMKYAGMFKIPVFSHCEEKKLTGKGQMNAGDQAALLGLAGISNDSEEVIVARDIILAKSAKAKLHICHVSTRGSVRLLREVKSQLQDVTCEITPHHFTLIDEDIKDYDANFKMSPPLRSEKDRAAVLEALKDGTADVIATDHAPHHCDEKNCEFEKAANGIVGLETAFALSYTELVEKNVLPPLDLVAKMTHNPAKILGMNKGTLSKGCVADIAIFDVENEYVIDISKFASKGKNSPFNDRKVKGKIEYTIVGGKIIVENGELTEESK